MVGESKPDIPLSVFRHCADDARPPPESFVLQCPLVAGQMVYVRAKGGYPKSAQPVHRDGRWQFRVVMRVMHRSQIRAGKSPELRLFRHTSRPDAATEIAAQGIDDTS